METKHIKSLIERHSVMLINNPYTYFELAYTRSTGWMAWICTNAKELDPERKVLASGQGETPNEACEDALSQLDKKA